MNNMFTYLNIDTNDTILNIKVKQILKKFKNLNLITVNNNKFK